MAVGKATTLVEREEELARLGALVERARAGVGGTVVVEGPPGIGKSALLLEARRRAAESGAQVFWARGAQLEQQSAFGVVRQLFALALARSPEQRRRAALSGSAGLIARALRLEADQTCEPPTTFSEVDVHHGLYWLCSNLADDGTVVIAVDDAHWADLPSLRWFGYLSRRLEDVAVLLVVAIATPVRDGALVPLAELRADPNTVTLRPGPLSQEAVADVVYRIYGKEPDEEFARACTEVTGGNPFFATVVVKAAMEAGLLPTADQADRVEHLVPPEITAAVMARIARLPSGAGRFARSVAVLGGTGHFRHAAALAGLDERHAAAAADDLVAADLLRSAAPTELAHPLVQRAVYASIPRFERRLAHRHAALLLDADGEPEEAVAAQLLQAEPTGAAWAVGVLRRAAAAAASTAAPHLAIGYLRRAMAEPPPEEVLGEVLHELGSVEAMTGEPQAVEHLTGALKAATDISRRAQVVLSLSKALAVSGREGDSLELLRQTVDMAGELDRELRLSLEGQLLAIGQSVPSGRLLIAERLDRVAAEVADGRTPAERRVLAFLAQENIMANQPAERVVQLARAALGGGRLLAEEKADSLLYYFPVDALALSGQLELAEAALNEARMEARARGSLAGFCASALSRCLLERERGAVRDVESEARAGFDAAVALGWSVHLPIFGAWLAEAMMERGEVEAARDVLDGIAFSDPSAYFLVGCRGRLNLATGRSEQGLEDLLDSGRRQLAVGIVSPAVYPWRSPAALALARLGDLDEARRLAAEELSLAEALGTARSIGVALRAVAVAERDDGKRIALLHRAENVLEDSGASLELAGARTDLGAALRAANRRTEAREPLRKALDAAHRCGATALAQRCLAELSATGARPRRASRSGLDALTPAERRVARLATEGLTTREIAQALFVSRKTVEKHLGQAYSKLGVHTREELQRKAGEPRRTALALLSDEPPGPARVAR